MNALTLYESIRPTIRTGDAILWQSNSIVGKIIQTFCHSPYNHVALVMRATQDGEERMLILEALENGIVPNSLSYRLSDQKGHAWLFPLHPDFDQIRPRMGSWAWKKVGTKYDFKGLFKNILGRVSSDARRMFCSEYWWLALKDSIQNTAIKSISRYNVIDSYQIYKEACKSLNNKAPRPSDFPRLQRCGIFGPEARIL